MDQNVTGLLHCVVTLTLFHIISCFILKSFYSKKKKKMVSDSLPAKVCAHTFKNEGKKHSNRMSSCDFFFLRT